MIDARTQALLFTQARTFHSWKPDPVDQSTLRALYDVLKWAPTSTNSQPLRLVFVTKPDEKEKLLTCVMAGNEAQTRLAPVTAILAYDEGFYEKLDILSPANKARTWFEGKAAFAKETAILNATLQGGYFILAARACGLDCGPMSGFNTEKVDALFFKGTRYHSLFLCNLGYGDHSALHPRGPRLSFEDACTLL